MKFFRISTILFFGKVEKMIISLLFPFISTSSSDNYFSEKLEIIQNRNGKVGFKFDFKTRIQWEHAFEDGLELAQVGEDLSSGQSHLIDGADLSFKSTGDVDVKHHNLLSKSIADLIEKFKVKELHLSFTQGRWAYDRWNFVFATTPDYDTPPPPGALLRVWLQDPAQFKGLTNALAGLFCSSLNFMSSSVTSSPVEPFSPFNPHLMGNASLKYSHLPREVVCTENLTPWAKLLPCKTKVPGFSP